MYLCMRSLLDLILIILFSPILLIVPTFHLCIYNPLFPSLSPEYYINVLIDNPMICDANVDLGYKDCMFNMLDGNVNNFISLGYFSGYNASLDPHYMCLVDKPRKIMWNTFCDFFFDFSIVFDLIRRALTFFNVLILLLSHCHAYESHVVVFIKLLCALTEFDVVNKVLKMLWSG